MTSAKFYNKKSIERYIAFIVIVFSVLFCFNMKMNSNNELNITMETMAAETILYGDINNDQSINPLDMTTFARKLANWVNYQNINSEAADLNYSDSVNPLDLTVFARYMANWIDYETLPYFNKNAVSWDYNGALPYDGTTKTVQLTGLPLGLTAIYSENTEVLTGNYIANAVLMFNDTVVQNISIAPLEWEINMQYIVTLTSDKNIVIPGETFEVNVNLLVPPTIIDCRIQVAYDSSLFEIVSLKYSDNSLLSANDYSDKGNYVNVIFSEDNNFYTTKGTVCKITFKVPETVVIGTSTPTSISILNETEFSTADFQTITGTNLDLRGVNINVTPSK